MFDNNQNCIIFFICIDICNHNNQFKWGSNEKIELDDFSFKTSQ